MFGFLNINKSSGQSSRAIVNVVQKLVRPAKVGHAGTLDPLATGVLIVGVGPATRLTQFVQRQPKVYVAEFQLGVHSETEDVESELIPVEDAPIVAEADLKKVLTQFVGEIMQLPPQYSALKVDGRRAYDMARKGQKIELKPRPIHIYELELNAFEYPNFTVTIRCGSGTYVRSLGRDIGNALGSGAVMTKLQRTAIGDFKVEDALIDTDINPDSMTSNLVLPHKGIVQTGTGNDDSVAIPVVKIDQSLVEKLSTGHTWSPPQKMEASQLLAVDEHGRLIAVLRELKPGLYSPKINFANHWLSQEQ